MPNGGLRSSVKTCKYKRSSTHGISVIKHAKDPDELFPTSDNGPEDDNGVDGYLYAPTLDWSLTFLP